jgi:peptidoglycan/LPS O-acetylase OafA/YrhL
LPVPENTYGSVAPHFGNHPGLDGLRGIAVAAVVAYHFGWISGGFLGVDAFFVLSGFLITSLLVAEKKRSGAIQLRDFWSRRVRRLLPALILMMTILVFVAGDSMKRAEVASSLAYVANWQQIWDGASYFDLFGEPSPLRHMWSLAVEEQFYLLWPLVVALVLRFGSRRALGALCLAGIVGSALAMAVWFDPVDPSRVYYGTDTRAHLLLVGGLLALVPRVRVPSSIGAAALVGSVALMLTARDDAAFLYQGGMLGHGILVALVIAAVVASPSARVSRALGAEPLRTLGRVSYGVYLWHWPVLILMTTERVGVAGWQLDALRIMTIAAATALSFVLVEKPIRHWRAPARAVLTSAAAALTAAFVLAAAAIPPASRDTVYLTAPRSPAEAARQVVPPPAPLPRARPARERATKLAAAKVRAPRKFGVVGDSVAATLAYGLTQIAPRHSIGVASATVVGCGVAAGIVLDKQGAPYPWAADCEKGVPNVLNGLVVQHDPDVVVWLSGWELADRQVDGRKVRWGTAEYDRQLERAIDEQFRRLTVRNARVIFLAPAPLVDGKLPGVDVDYERYEHYRELLSEFAASHAPYAAVVDVAPIVCPSGPPCARIVDGVEWRPDGAHFSKESAPLVAEQLLPRILEALSRPSPARGRPTQGDRTSADGVPTLALFGRR